jgi:hypothetical protein
MKTPEPNDGKPRRTGCRNATRRRRDVVALLIMILLIAAPSGCALYRAGDPDDSKYHLIQGQSAHYEKVLEFYIAASTGTSSVLPNDAVDKLFEAPVWSAPSGVQLTATTVGKVEKANVRWKSEYREHEASGYRLQLNCDCTVLPDASEGNGAIVVQFPRLKSDLGRDKQNNPRHARFVSDYKRNLPSTDNKISLFDVKVYPSGWARFVNLYSPWLIVLAIGLVVLLVGRAIARRRA